MPARTLTELLAPESQDQIKARLLALMNRDGFPVTDWESGGFTRTFIETLSLAYRDLVGNLIPQIAGGGFLDYAPDDDDSWLTLLAEQMYSITRTEATHTIQKITLTCDGSNGPYTISAGQLMFRSTSGRRYANTTGGTLNTSGTLVVEAKSESPNDSSDPETNYVDGSGTITEMVTPLPGVTCSNLKTDFTPVVKSGKSSGTVTLSRTSGGVPPTDASFRITIKASGNVGVATAVYELNANGIQVELGVVGAHQLFNGTTVTFGAGAVSPHFIAGDTFTFGSPGSPVVQQGRDKESRTALIERCRARWPALATVPTDDKYILWSKLASDQVTKVRIAPSTTVGGRTDIWIAGAVNPLDAGVVTAVQNYVNARDGVSDLAVVASASGVDIQVTGQVTCPAGKSADVKAALDAAWTAYIASIDIGGIVRLSELAEACMDAGALDIEDLAITGANVEASPVDSSPNVNRQLTSTQVAQVNSAHVPSLALSWFEE